MYRPRGFTLIELLIAIAILAILVTIAIPSYRGYIDEAKFAKLRSGIDTMRVFLEDYRLDNGQYVAAQWLADGSVTTIETLYGWAPGGENKTDYTVTVNADGTSYNVTAQEAFGGTTWVRCDDRMRNCCYSDPDAPAPPPAACP